MKTKEEKAAEAAKQAEATKAFAATLKVKQERYSIVCKEKAELEAWAKDNLPDGVKLTMPKVKAGDAKTAALVDEATEKLQADPRLKAGGKINDTQFREVLNIFDINQGTKLKKALVEAKIITAVKREDGKFAAGIYLYKPEHEAAPAAEQV